MLLLLALSAAVKAVGCCKKSCKSCKNLP